MNEQQWELAGQLADAERAEAIDAAARVVAAAGRDDCLDCDAEIPLERRQAAPFATRCLSCQQDHELVQAHQRFNRFF